jgi:hypothetical protein
MSVCADVQSARPIAIAKPFAAEAASTADLPAENLIWITMVRPPSDSLVIPVAVGSRPFAPARIISDEQMDSEDWIAYEYPWSPKEISGFIAGEIQWPGVDLDY